MKPWIVTLIAFLLGLGLGWAGPVLVPQVTPYLSRIIPAKLESVVGVVVRKQREPDRLLLTISTEKGVLLATFKEKIEEIDLLIDHGYSVTIGLRDYSPFVENPTIERVHTTPATEEPALPAPSPTTGVEKQPPP